MRLMVKKFKEGSKALFEELKLWMDEIFGVGKKVEDFALTDKQRKIKELLEEKARKIQETIDRKKGKSDFDWMSSRKTGNLGGNILKESQIRKLRGLLKEKGIDLIGI